VYLSILKLGLGHPFSPMGEFVECGDSSPHGSESGDKSPHSTFVGLNDDQGQIAFKPHSVWLFS